MAGVYFTFDNFRSLVSHEIGVLERFDKQKETKFSLLFFPMKNMDTTSVMHAMKKILRESDAVFEHKDGYYLLLSRTDLEGALHVLNQFEDFFGEKLSEVILTYPDDGNSAEVIFKKLHDYAKNWCQSELSFPELKK